MKSKLSDKILISTFYALITIFAVACLIPIWMAFSVSISNEHEVAMKGFSLLPMKPTLDNYKYMIENKGSMLLSSYGITLFTVIVGTLFSMIVTVTYAYAASTKSFRYSNVLSFIGWFTMVFNGGLLPWYILCTKYYGLQNNLFALFVPYAMNVFNMFLMRNYFKGIPNELIEAAKIDGANNFKTFIVVVLPLSKVGIVTIGLFYVLSYWNDFFLSLMLITTTKLYPVQLLLYNMMVNISFLTSGSASTIAGEAASHVTIPLMTARMVLTCLAIGPIILVYSFAQRYFVKGITIGAIKG